MMVRPDGRNWTRETGNESGIPPGDGGGGYCLQAFSGGGTYLREGA